MDLLAKELQRKKQALARAKEETSVPAFLLGEKRKFLRVGDIRRAEEEAREREEEERRRRQRQQHQQQENTDSKSKAKVKIGSDHAVPATTVHDSSASHRPIKTKRPRTEASSHAMSQSEQQTSGLLDKVKEAPLVPSSSQRFSSEELTKKFRALGLPVRYFGETPSQRLTRFEQALNDQTNRLQGLSEKEEFRLGKGHGIRNPFLEKDKTSNTQFVHDDSGKADYEEGARKSKTQDQQEEKEEEKEEDDSDDPHKQIYKFLKGLLGITQQSFD